MKKYILLLMAFLVSGTVLATVGGPTYIHSIALNPGENSLYYIQNAQDGRGCPPIVYKVNLSVQNLIPAVLKSCDEIEADPNYPSNHEEYPQFILETYQNLSYLGSVSLEKNNIDVQVEFLSEHKEEGMTFWSEFEATILQDDKEVGKINFRGCSEDQPHIFEGYMIPNSTSMAFLISNKGDCFEGGYVKETLHVIKGIEYKDTTIVRDIKTDSATEPNSGNKVVYAGVAETANEEVVPIAKKTNTNLYLILAVVLGLVLGYLLGRGRSAQQ